MKSYLYHFLHHNRTFIKFIYGLIIANVVALILESYKEIRMDYGTFFQIFEIVSVLIFSVEYLLRLWTADLEKQYTGSSWQKRWKFATSTMGLIDLVAILPFYLPFLFAFDLRVLRILRLFRLLRIFKITRYSRSLKLVTNVLNETKSELAITLFTAFILLVISSTLMYYIESDVQPENFASIGHSFWWAIATLTTVGYGDVYPITGLGKLLSAIIAMIGIGFIALPTGIISSAFMEKVQEQKESKVCKCPNCGTIIEK